MTVVVLLPAPPGMVMCGLWTLEAVMPHLIGFLLARAYADQSKMEEVVRTSDLQWTIVRLNRLLDGAATGGTRVSRGLIRKPTAQTRADVAVTPLDILADPATNQAEFNTVGPLR